VAKGFKLRLPDGSEIGPMDLQAVKDWYRQGLVGKDDMVLKPGTTRWIPLRQAIALDDDASTRPVSPAGASAALRAAVREAAAAPRPTATPVGRAPVTARPAAGGESRRTVLGGALLLAGALAPAFFAFFPARALPALDRAPWREIALGLAALGLLLIRGWELSRKAVRLLLVVAAVTLFPVTGILIAQGVRGAALLVVGCAFAFLLGLVVLLAGGHQGLLRVAPSVLLILAAGAGVVRFGLATESSEARQVREWAVADRTYEDASSGVRLQFPESWVKLKPDQNVVSSTLGAPRLVLAQPRLGGYAMLLSETTTQVLTSDQFLSRILTLRNLHGRTEVERKDVLLGRLPARQVVSTWEKDGRQFRDLTVAARDGRTYWSLATWIPDDGSARPAQELESLVDGLSLDGTMATRLQDAVQAAVAEVPFLSVLAAEGVISRLDTATPEPVEVFRRALEMAARGAATLTPGELQELESLNAVVYGSVARRERSRLMAYIGRVRDGRPTTPEDDRGMAVLMRDAVLQLESSRRSRLVTLYDKAIGTEVPAPR
jgi:hypothetical protein